MNIFMIPATEVTRDICDEQDIYDRMVEHPGTLFHFRFIQEVSAPVFALGGFTSDKNHFIIVPHELYQSSLVGYLRQIVRKQFPNAISQQINELIKKILEADEYESYYNFYRHASMRMRKSDRWLKKYNMFLKQHKTISDEEIKIKKHKKRKGLRSEK